MMKKIYLDYAASTPVDPRVVAAMEPFFLEHFGNPKAIHSFGQEAMAAIDHAREKIARALGADFREIIFTGSATEANNLALRGTFFSFKEGFREAESRAPRLVISSIEHESIEKTASDLERSGCEVVRVPVDEQGTIDIRALRAAINERTFLVSIMYANNEIGSVQPIARIAEAISDFKKERQSRTYPLFHTDAVQAFQFLDCDVRRLGADMMTFSSHKIYGPKGVGGFYVGGNAAGNLRPIITGGGQEFSLRSGTENVPIIVGFGKAVELLFPKKESEAKRIANLRAHFVDSLKEVFPEIVVNGGSREILPNIANITFPHWSAGDVLARFDLRGLAVGTSSACASRRAVPSRTLRAMGVSDERAAGSIRFSFGRPTTENEIKRALAIIKSALNNK